jgi:hypothetical protein
MLVPAVRRFDRSPTVRRHLFGVTFQARHNSPGAGLHARAQRLHVLLAGRGRAAARRDGRIIGERRHGNETEEGNGVERFAEFHENFPGC